MYSLDVCSDIPVSQMKNLEKIFARIFEKQEKQNGHHVIIAQKNYS